MHDSTNVARFQTLSLRLFRVRPLAAVAAAVVALVLPPVRATAQTPTLDSEEAAFLTLINNYRAQHGAGPLKVSIALQNASEWMSADMAAKGYFSHTDSLGRDPGARIASFGYTYYPWGENLAAGNSDAQSTLNQWISSPGHNANMLDPSYKVIGIGRAYNASSPYRWYWTTDFGGVVDATLDPNPPPPSSPPVISFFSATPATITAGGTSTLSWSVSGATRVTLDNGIGDVTGVTSRAVFPPTTTTYTLTAVNSSGASVTARATVQVNAASDTQPPTAPALSASARSYNQVDLAWTASTDNTGVTGYRVFRNGTLLVTTPGTVRSYSDTSVSAITAYSYYVQAIDAAGNTSPSSNVAQVSTPAQVVTMPCPAPSTGTFTGCYYNNLTLNGDPVFVRTDGQINFDWGSASPDRSLTPGNFSARWQGRFYFDQGVYTFKASASDGMRLYLDGNLVIDRWIDQPVYTATVQQTLAAGTHLVTFEYYDRSLTAKASLSWQSTATPPQTPPAISFFAATPSAITAGQSATLSWSVSGATSVVIDNGVGDVTNATSRLVSPAATTTYTLTATNAGGSVTSRATVTVSPGSGSGSPSQIVLPASMNVAPGQSAPFQVSLAAPAPPGGIFLALTSSDTSKATVFPANIYLAQGMTTASVAATVIGVNPGSAVITASAFGLTPNSFPVQVGQGGSTPPPPGPGPSTPPSVTAFSASPSNITAGQSAVLTWTVTGATSVTIDNGVGNVTGLSSKTVSPSQTTTYTLTATSATGSVTARATVTVNAPAPQPGGGSEQFIVPSDLRVAPGATTTFYLRLAAPAPAGGVFITLTSSDESKMLVSPSSVYMAAGATQSAIRLTGVAPGTANLTVSAYGYPSTTRTVQVQ